MWSGIRSVCAIVAKYYGVLLAPLPRLGPTDEDSAELGATIADRSPEESTVEALESADALRALEGALSSLARAERTIIVRRYGIDGRQPKTTATEIADELGLSRERVRQL